MILVVLLDISVVFYIIDLSILLNHLLALELGGTVLWWFEPYLGGWSQKLVLENSRSATWALMCGILQGLILSPPCCLIFIEADGRHH